MTVFWLLALVLLIPALLIFLWPVLKVRKHQAEEDRTALNVALYQERVAELESQHAAGMLDSAQLEQGRLDAARDLLEDTEQGAPAKTAHLGITLPLIAALLIPVASAALYMHWGSSEKVALTLSLAEQPKTTQEAIVRLESMVRLQPDSADAWFFLGRAYMSEQQHGQAAEAFRRTLELVGRQPEVLAQWAQAQYFATDKQWSDALQEAVDVVFAANPKDVVTLGFVGIAAYESGNFSVALDAWTRLLSVVDTREPSSQAVLTGIERAEQAVAQFGENNPNAKPGPKLPPLPDVMELSEKGRIKVRVAIADTLVSTLNPDAAVFVFASSSQSGRIPLAAQRLSVGQLPIEIQLSDADALIPQMLLSAAADVQLQASIASNGNASEPEWVSEVKQAVVEDGQVFDLLIERAVTQDTDNAAP